MGLVRMQRMLEVVLSGTLPNLPQAYGLPSALYLMDNGIYCQHRTPDDQGTAVKKQRARGWRFKRVSPGTRSMGSIDTTLSWPTLAKSQTKLRWNDERTFHIRFRMKREVGSYPSFSEQILYAAGWFCAPLSLSSLNSPSLCMTVSLPCKPI